MTIIANDRPEAFTMTRGNDESGVSGTGAVLEGVIFSDGTVAARWLTETASSTFYDSIPDFIKIHIYSHPSNKTRLIFQSKSWDQDYMHKLVDKHAPIKHKG